MSVRFYQIYYRDDQKSKLYPFSIPYFNETLTIYFENSPIRKIIEATNENEVEKIGICSWKLGSKMRRGRLFTQKDLEKNYEVLSFTINSSRHCMIAMAKAWHPMFIPAIDLLWAKLGYKRPPEARHPIYQNAFACKTPIYKDYVTNFLAPAMDLIETDAELHEIMLRESNYGTLSRDADLKSVKAKLSLDFFPLCPFVLERCFSLWLTMKKIPVTYLSPI